MESYFGIDGTNWGVIPGQQRHMGGYPGIGEIHTWGFPGTVETDGEAIGGTQDSRDCWVE